MQHDPEPQPVDGHPEPSCGRDYVSVEEEDLTWLSGPPRCEQRSRIVLSQNPRGEEPEQESDWGGQRHTSDGPSKVAGAGCGTLHDGLHQPSEALDVEVDPLRPVCDPQLSAARRSLRQLDAGE